MFEILDKMHNIVTSNYIPEIKNFGDIIRLRLTYSSFKAQLNFNAYCNFNAVPHIRIEI